MIGLFCKRALSKRRYSAKETYHFKEDMDDHLIEMIPKNHTHTHTHTHKHKKIFLVD